MIQYNIRFESDIHLNQLKNQVNNNINNNNDIDNDNDNQGSKELTNRLILNFSNLLKESESINNNFKNKKLSISKLENENNNIDKINDYQKKNRIL